MINVKFPTKLPKTGFLAFDLELLEIICTSDESFCTNLVKLKKITFKSSESAKDYIQVNLYLKLGELLALPMYLFFDFIEP